MRAVAQEQRAGASRRGITLKIRDFFRDSWLELQKVIWPSFDDVMKMTGLTVAVVFIVGLFMFLWGEVLTVFTQSLFK